MSRPKKNPQYDAEHLMQEILEAVGDAYLHPLSSSVDGKGYASLSFLADEFSMTPLKIRKLLITSGLYECEQSRLVVKLKNQGKTFDEIQAYTGLSRASVHSYLPYTKGIYNMRELSAQAERLRRYRDRKYKVKQLTAAILEPDAEMPYNLFWETLCAFADYPFRTVNGVKFRYVMEENAINFPESKKKILRSCLNELLTQTIQAQKNVFMEPHDRAETTEDECLLIVLHRIGAL